MMCDKLHGRAGKLKQKKDTCACRQGSRTGYRACSPLQRSVCFWQEQMEGAVEGCQQSDLDETGPELQ